MHKNGIRNAYWEARSGNNVGELHSRSEGPDAHVRHCLEYLRQSLMCLADTTPERTELNAAGQRGARGFGVQHVCRDYNQLVEWTTRQEPETVEPQ